MAGLVPATQRHCRRRDLRWRRRGKLPTPRFWVAGTSPAMTADMLKLGRRPHRGAFDDGAPGGFHREAEHVAQRGFDAVGVEELDDGLAADRAGGEAVEEQAVAGVFRR